MRHMFDFSADSVRPVPMDDLDGDFVLHHLQDVFQIVLSLQNGLSAGFDVKCFHRVASWLS